MQGELFFGVHIWKEFSLTSFACTGHTTIALGQKINKDSSFVFFQVNPCTKKKVRFCGLPSKYVVRNVDLDLAKFSLV